MPGPLFHPRDLTRLLNYFNCCNFTHAEDVPLDGEMAHDPEMLGKVFENLLEKEERLAPNEAALRGKWVAAAPPGFAFRRPGAWDNQRNLREVSTVGQPML